MHLTATSHQRDFRWPLFQQLGSVYRNRVLAWEMGRRDLLVFNKGTVLGFSWLIVRPLIQVSAYVVIVSIIFRVPFDSDKGRFGFILYVLSGTVPWQLMTSVLQEAPSYVRSRIELLKQVVFPLEILPITNIIVAALGPLISLAVYFVLAGSVGALHWSVLLLPVPLVLLFIFVLGCAWFLMVVGMLFVDLREVVAIVMGMLVYMSPVVLTEKAVGPAIWHLLNFNPLFHVVICFRDVFEAEFHPLNWVLFVGISVAALLAGSFSVAGAKRIASELI
jgi:lipopolysaccharide transport system permease protein